MAKVPPQLRAHLFKKGHGKTKAAGRKGGKKSRPNPFAKKK